jgi:high-affinity iron transporter
VRGFEAALVVAIVLAAVKRSERPELARWVWYGSGAAAVLAILVGWLLHVTIEDLTGVARSRVFAIICFAAAGLLTWMIFWMRNHARSLKGALEGKTRAALEQSAFALGMVAFVAVAREGLETALFLISTTANSSGNDVLIGGLIGLAIAAGLGVLVYHGSRFLPLRRFFQVTGVLIILVRRRAAVLGGFCSYSRRRPRHGEQRRLQPHRAAVADPEHAERALPGRHLRLGSAAVDRARSRLPRAT